MRLPWGMGGYGFPSLDKEGWRAVCRVGTAHQAVAETMIMASCKNLLTELPTVKLVVHIAILFLKCCYGMSIAAVRLNGSDFKLSTSGAIGLLKFDGRIEAMPSQRGNR